MSGLLVAAAGLLVAATNPASTAVAVTSVSVASGGLGVLFVVAAATALSQVDHTEAGTVSGPLSQERV